MIPPLEISWGVDESALHGNKSQKTSSKGLGSRVIGRSGVKGLYDNHEGALLKRIF